MKNYFIGRYSIKYRNIQQRFRFDGQAGEIDVDGKLRVVVSSDILDSLPNRYGREVYNTIPLYFLTVNSINHKCIVSLYFLLLELYCGLSSFLCASFIQKMKSIETVAI